ncbi:MAG: LemA family protein [Terrimicrobiaceae bacterium]
MTSFFVLIPVLLFFGWATWAYNRLIKARNQQAEAWSGVDVQLKKRADLIPPLVECVSAYRTHESQTFRETATGRQPAEVAKEMRGLLAVAEGYPELKAAENFRKLMDQLVKIEDDLQYARRYYNGSVRDYRNLAGSFPSNIIAGVFGFQGGEFFEVESVLERANPEVKL